MAKDNQLITQGAQIGLSDEFQFEGHQIRCYVNERGTLNLSVEDCAKALGVTQTKKTKSGDSTTVRWERVYRDLIKINKISTCGDWEVLSIEQKKEVRLRLQEMFITEPEMYGWSFNAETEQGIRFRSWIAEDVLPCIRKYGVYILGWQTMTAQELITAGNERIRYLVLREFGIGKRKNFTGILQQVLNLGPNDGYVYANYTDIIYKVIFGMATFQFKVSRGLGKKDSLRDYLKASDEGYMLERIAAVEDMAADFIMAGIVEETLLQNTLRRWYANKYNGLIK